MPTSTKLFLKTFLYVLCSILQVSQLTFHHLTIDVFRDQQSVLTHVHLHITELDISGDLDVRCLPILGNPSSTHFFIITCSLCLLLLRCHYCMFKIFYYQFQNYTSIIKKNQFKPEHLCRLSTSVKVKEPIFCVSSFSTDLFSRVLIRWIE
jgi:hypothetical protein